VGGSDEGQWMNKTIFLQKNEKDAAQIEMVIKYPKFFIPGWKPGMKQRELPKMVLPVKLSPRAMTYWQEALTKKVSLTFTLQPLKDTRWRVTGVFKDPKVPEFVLTINR
jgi:hypothetical protein